MLRRAVLVMWVFHGDAHLLQREHGVAPQVGSVVEAGQIEVAAAVEHLGALGVPFEVVELQLGADVERIPHLLRLLHRAGQHLTRVALERRAVGVRRPQNMRATALDSGRQGSTWNVEASGNASMSDSCVRQKPFDAAAVEAHAVGEGAPPARSG